MKLKKKERKGKVEEEFLVSSCFLFKKPARVLGLCREPESLFFFVFFSDFVFREKRKLWNLRKKKRKGKVEEEFPVYSCFLFKKPARVLEWVLRRAPLSWLRTCTPALRLQLSGAGSGSLLVPKVDVSTHAPLFHGTRDLVSFYRWKIDKRWKEVKIYILFKELKVYCNKCSVSYKKIVCFWMCLLFPRTKN